MADVGRYSTDTRRLAVSTFLVKSTPQEEPCFFAKGSSGRSPTWPAGQAPGGQDAGLPGGNLYTEPCNTNCVSCPPRPPRLSDPKSGRTR